jgi:hypothetical protein
MERILLTAVTLITLVSFSSGQEKDFGLGVLFGEPTGLSGKYWTSSRNAIDAGVAWSFKKSGFFHLHADYLWHFPEVIRSSDRFPLYAGVGGRVRFDDPVRVGVRIPLGIAWWPHGAPLDVFLEVVPVLDLAPKTEFDMNGGVGARYHFE